MIAVMRLWCLSTVAALGFADASGQFAHAQTVPVISASNGLASESDGFAEFVVRLSAPGTQNASAYYFTRPGNASSSDFAPIDGFTNLAFAPGETVKIIRVPITEDCLVEGPESFYLALSGPGNAVIGTGSATGTMVLSRGWLELRVA